MTQMTTSRAAEVAGYLKQWMFDPNHPHHPLRAKPNFNGPADRNTNLKNSHERKFLQWEEQTFGINLGWTERCLAGHGGQGFALVLHPARRRLITHPLRPVDRARVRHQPVLHLLHGADLRR